MPRGSEPSTDEVVTALAHMACTALVLAIVVLAARAAQMYMDQQQAARAHQAAVESSHQRLRTLSDRSRLYLADTDAAAGGGIGKAAWPSAAPRPLVGDNASDSRDSSLDGDPRISSGAGGSSGRLFGGGSPIGSGPKGAGGTNGGAVSLLTAAARVLLHRRNSASPSATSASAASAINSDTATLSSGSSSAGSHSSSTHSTVSSISNTIQARSTPQRSRSSLSVYNQHAVYDTAGNGAGSPWRGSGGDSSFPPLQHKASDSLLETCRVLSSVPPETITSTRQVLAAFNYDYSALHRRESAYVSGPGRWRSRTGL